MMRADLAGTPALSSVGTTTSTTTHAATTPAPPGPGAGGVSAGLAGGVVVVIVIVVILVMRRRNCRRDDVEERIIGGSSVGGRQGARQSRRTYWDRLDQDLRDNVARILVDVGDLTMEGSIGKGRRRVTCGVTSAGDGASCVA